MPFFKPNKIWFWLKTKWYSWHYEESKSSAFYFNLKKNFEINVKAKHLRFLYGLKRSGFYIVSIFPQLAVTFQAWTGTLGTLQENFHQSQKVTEFLFLLCLFVILFERPTTDLPNTRCILPLSYLCLCSFCNFILNFYWFYGDQQ